MIQRPRYYEPLGIEIATKKAIPLDNAPDPVSFCSEQSAVMHQYFGMSDDMHGTE